jgi:hypothetical protein
VPAWVFTFTIAVTLKDGLDDSRRLSLARNDGDVELRTQRSPGVVRLVKLEPSATSSFRLAPEAPGRNRERNLVPLNSHPFGSHLPHKTGRLAMESLPREEVQET